MGTVVAATHLGLGRKVALKFMRLGVLDNDEAIGRFMLEARAAATLRSEHVAQVMDVEVDTEDGAPYIVMEYLDGSDLGSILKARGVPAPAEAVRYVMQACEGLAEAHAKGIVHRDLKPANLFLTRRPDGTPLIKVLDFGVSKLNEAAHSGTFRLTQPRKTVGSPQYMSPEQMVASPEVDSRADIWALGVILYELLAGKPPFVAANFLELGLEVTNRAHPSLARLVPGLAAGLVAVVDRCLQKAPASRFPDLAVLAAALVPHAGAGAEASAVRIARILRVAKQTTEPMAMVTPSGRRRRLVVYGLIGGVLTAAAIVAGGVIYRRQGGAIVPERTDSLVVPPATTSSGPRAAAPAPSASPSSPPATTPPPSRDEPAQVSAPPRRPGATSNRLRRRVPESRSDERAVSPGAPAVVDPTPPRPADEGGATRTKRGPVVTDL